MPKILVMRYKEGVLVPRDITEEKKKEVREKIDTFLKDNPEVKFNGLWVSDNGIGICDWEAPDAETIEKAIEAVGLPHDEIIKVKNIMP